MISVTRKTHMPSVEDSNCCSLSSKWCRKPGSCTTKAAASLSANLHLPFFTGVVIRRLGHHWLMLKVEGRWRCGRLFPLQTLRVPGILRRPGALPPGPCEVDHRQQVPYRQNGSSGSGHDVQHLKFRGVMRVTPWHSLVSENELWEERQVKSHEDHQRGKLCPAFRVHAAGNLREPEVNAAQVGHHHSTHHHVVKVRDHEI